jgi:fumarate hydratase class I
MSTKPFVYQDPFPLAHDDTEYYLLSKEHVSVAEFDGQQVLKVEPQALTLLAQQAFHDAAFMLRVSHQQQVASILLDPEASDNDKYVALQFLRNSEIAAKGVLPTCQDTGTAIIMGKKGQRVWTGGGDEAALAQGVYNTYTEDNLRYSQNAPLDMYKEVNTGTNLPAQIDLYSVDGDEYKFLCMAKGGGSANKTYLYQETKALITPAKLKNYLVEKMRTLGTAACPPYHIAFVIGGTSAEATLKTVKLASTRYYDGLPTEGNEHGQAFRDVQLEQELLQEAQNLGLGAQFGGKYFAHDIRVIRLPRHGASCPIGMGVSCSADRNIKAKINRDGIWIEKLESNPGNIFLNICVSRRRRSGQHQPESADERDPGAAVGASGLHPPEPQRHHHRGPRHRPRQAERAYRQRRGAAAVRQRSPDLLRGPGENAAGYASGSSAQPPLAAWTLTSICCSPTARAW